MGLLRDEAHFDRTMMEAVVFGMPAELRSLFAALLAFSDVSDAPTLWEKFRNDLSEDYVHRGCTRNDSIIHAYFDILESALCMGIDLRSHIPPPAPCRPQSASTFVTAIDHANIGSEMYAKLNVKQKEAADHILKPPLPNQPSCFFVDGPGGSGKTFLYNCLYHKLLGDGKNVACVAWTGIAANLLPGGRTLHSLFKLSIPQANKISTIKNQSKEAQLLRETSVFVIDECSMIPRWSLDAIDSLLRDTMANDVPFGGKTMVLGGDFRQVLPVVERGRGSDAVEACLKNSALFPLFRKLSLLQNMRVSPTSTNWSSLLLSIGNGTKEEDETGCISIPQSMISSGDLITETFNNNFNDPDIFAERAILAPKNIDVNEMNSTVLQKLTGRLGVFRSIDEVDTEDPDDVINFPVEFLNKQNPSGSPPHLLTLKIGAVIMLLRNLDVSKGLCNGTRLIVVDFSGRILQCKFISGERKGTVVFIPRIDNFTEKGLPFRLRRRQFPVRLAFAMTVNKSQGQSLTHVGLYLPKPVFGHGQLYVALSRARSMEGVKILSNKDMIKNIVEKSVL